MVKKGRVNKWLNRDERNRKEGRKKVRRKKRREGKKRREKGDLSFGF